MLKVNPMVNEGTGRRQLKMKLFIADDNAAFRTHLVSSLLNTGGIEIVGEAGDVPESIAMIRKTKPDVVILDLHMPGGNGLDVLQQVKSSRPSPIVILLTVGPRSEYQTLSYLAGADYFFEKSSDLRKMVRMLKRSVKKYEINTEQKKGKAVGHEK
jgi:DNA-binding NarL/FixJ family response regulator